MIRINLLGSHDVGRPDSPARRSGEIRELAATVVALAAVAAASALAVSEAWSFRVSARAIADEVAAADADRRANAAAAETLEAEEERHAILARQLEQLSRWRQSRPSAVRLLEAVSHGLPDELWLTELRQEAGATLLLGRTTRPATVFEFTSNLESSGWAAAPVEVAGIDVEGVGRFEIRVEGSTAEE